MARKRRAPQKKRPQQPRRPVRTSWWNRPVLWLWSIVAAGVLAIATAFGTGFGQRLFSEAFPPPPSSSASAANAGPSSCNFAVQARDPLLYKVVSTETKTGDGTAIAHEIYGNGNGNGWIQQVFLATRNQIGEVSAIISTHETPSQPLAIVFQISTLDNRIVGTINGRYDGSTNNKDFGNFFHKPISLIPGRLYVLRVINVSPQPVFVYTHIADRPQYVPYRIPACEHNSADGGPEDYTMQTNLGIEVAVSSDRSNSGRWNLGFLKHQLREHFAWLTESEYSTGPVIKRVSYHP